MGGIGSGKKPIHGMCRSPEYYIWVGMKGRCFNKKNKSFRRYGAVGITVCEEWAEPNGFINFFRYMGKKPSAKHSIDRIDSRGNYEPGNVRWALPVQQNNNRPSINRMLSFNGEEKTLSQWATEYEIAYHTLNKRLALGWQIERALTDPVRS